MSKETKHTPGPWEADYGCTVGHIKSVWPGHEHGMTPTVARYDMCAPSILGADEPQFNAHLIAAAPELLAALERLLQANEADYEHLPDATVRVSFETNSMAIKQARAAIAKAKGE